MLSSSMMSQPLRSSCSGRSFRAVLVRMSSTQVVCGGSGTANSISKQRSSGLIKGLTVDRHFSNYNRPQSPPPHNYFSRPYPVYSVPGEVCTLSVKFMPPGFKVVGQSNMLVLDTSRRGRMLFEFSPRAADGSVVWNQAVRFGLSAEEVGLFINQLPQYSIELSRSPGKFGAPDNDGSGGDKGGNVVDPIDKVLKIEPGESGTVKFTVDFMKEGVGGQEYDGIKGPLSITVEAGEFEVITALLKDTIPTLVGWKQLVDRAVEGSIADGINMSKNRAPGNVPF